MTEKTAVPSLRLYLLRHAKAAPASAGQTDFNRTLEDGGYADAEIVADMAADRGLIPDTILCSTATRCRQTADAFHRAVSADIPIAYIDALYTGPVDAYRALVDAHRTAKSLMIVGHNPMIEEFLREMLDPAEAAVKMESGYPTGALAAIDLNAADPAFPNCRGSLAGWLLPVREVH